MGNLRQQHSYRRLRSILSQCFAVFISTLFLCEGCASRHKDIKLPKNEPVPIKSVTVSKVLIFADEPGASVRTGAGMGVGAAAGGLAVGRLVLTPLGGAVLGAIAGLIETATDVHMGAKVRKKAKKIDHMIQDCISECLHDGFVDGLNKSGLYSYIEPTERSEADAELVLIVKAYGFVHDFAARGRYNPYLVVVGKLILNPPFEVRRREAGNQDDRSIEVTNPAEHPTVWSKVVGTADAKKDLPRYLLETYLKNPQAVKAAFRKASRVVVDELLADLTASPRAGDY